MDLGSQPIMHVSTLAFGPAKGTFLIIMLLLYPISQQSQKQQILNRQSCIIWYIVLYFGFGIIATAAISRG